MTTPETKDAGRVSIREAVREGVASLGERTRTQVIEHFAQKQADKQADALVKALDKLTELEREGYKIKPSYVGFNEAGEGIGEPFYTKDQLEQRKKNSEQIEKLTRAINKADDKDDFGDLYNLVK